MDTVKETLDICGICGDRAHLYGKVFGRTPRWRVRHVCCDRVVYTKWRDSEQAAINDWNAACKAMYEQGGAL